jgi:hypothetical protein
MKRIILLTLLILTYNGVAAIDLHKSPTKAALLSLAIPGGGQYYNSSYKKMFFFGSIELSLIGLLAYHNNRMDYYFDKINQNSGNYNDNLSKYNRYYNKIQSDYWWIGTTVLMSALDSYVDSHLLDFNYKSRALNIKFNADRLELSYNFY